MGEEERKRREGRRKGRYNAGLSRESTFLDTSPLSYCPPPNARTKDSKEKKFNSAFKLFPPLPFIPTQSCPTATHRPHPRNAAFLLRRLYTARSHVYIYIKQCGFEIDIEANFFLNAQQHIYYNVKNLGVKILVLKINSKNELIIILQA